MDGHKQYIRVKGKKISRSTDEPIILIEPIKDSNLSDYRLEIVFLQKDFPVSEINEDLHYIYESDIIKFFQRHSEVNIQDFPTSHLFLYDHALEKI
jgi:hypothetical protein